MSFRFDLSKLFDPAVIAVLLHSADVAVEKASPDYTIAHHVAATLEHLMGQQPVSTPRASDAEPVLKAIVEAGEAVAPAVAGVVAP